MLFSLNITDYLKPVKMSFVVGAYDPNDGRAAGQERLTWRLYFYLRYLANRLA